MQFSDLSPEQQAALVKRIERHNAQVRRLIARQERAARTTAATLRKHL